MKRFEDLTDDEVLALTEEQVRYYTDLACAENGAPLLPPDPGPEPIEPKHQPDVIVFDVAGIELTSQEEAVRLADHVNTLSRVETHYVSGPLYKKVARPPSRPIAVTSERYYSPALWETVREEFGRYGTAKKEWDADTKAYREASENRETTAGWVRERIEDVRENDRRRQRYRADLARYVEIADGDEAMARRFLLKAHPEAEKFLPPAPVLEAATT